jgi:hypothetical protein
VQVEDYTTHVIALQVCGIWTVDQVLGQHLTKQEEEEVAELKATFLDTLKGLQAARKYMCQFDTENNIVI